MRLNMFVAISVLSVLLCICVEIVHAEKLVPTSYKVSDFNKTDLDFSGLDEQQSELVLRILNNNNCLCGCTKGTWANCIKTDIHCPYSRPVGKKVIEMIKAGKSDIYVLGFLDGWGEGKAASKSSGNKTDDPNKIYPVSKMNAPFIGSERASVMMIEYTDYQCGYCRRVQETTKELLKEYGEKLCFAVMNNPLSFHREALSAAMASRAAGIQGKFWEMNGLLFANPQSVNEDGYIKLAKEIGLDIEKFNKDRKDEQLKAEILKEQQQAINFGATGTPSFFINGKKITGAKEIEEFRKTINEAIKRLP